MARLVGIPVNRVITATFIIGSGLAAVAGFMFAMFNSVILFYDGYLPGMKAFTAAVLGGWAFWLEPASLVVRRHEAPAPRDGLRGWLDSARSRVVRGGSYHSSVRVALRGFYRPDHRYELLGFRPARTIEE